MKKQIYQLSCDEIRDMCNKRDDCMGCRLYYENGVCAKDLTNGGETDLRSLYLFLSRGVDNDSV